METCKRGWWSMGWVGVALLTSLGCQYPDKEWVRIIHKENLDKLDVHDKHMTEDHKVQTPAKAAELDALRKQTADEFDRIHRAAEAAEAKLEQAQNEAMERLASIAARVLGVEGLIPETKALAKEAGNEARVASRAAEKTESFVALVRDAVNTKISDLDKAMEKLDKGTQDKLASVTAETTDKLRAAAADREKFEKILADEVQLIPDRIQKFKGFTTEQIIALIGAAGVAAAAGVAGGRSGKSRSQPAIDELYDKFEALATDIALNKKPPQT